MGVNKNVTRMCAFPAYHESATLLCAATMSGRLTRRVHGSRIAAVAAAAHVNVGGRIALEARGIGPGRLRRSRCCSGQAVLGRVVGLGVVEVVGQSCSWRQIGMRRRKWVACLLRLRRLLLALLDVRRRHALFSFVPGGRVMRDLRRVLLLLLWGKVGTRAKCPWTHWSRRRRRRHCERWDGNKTRTYARTLFQSTDNYNLRMTAQALSHMLRHMAYPSNPPPATAGAPARPCRLLLPPARIARSCRLRPDDARRCDACALRTNTHTRTLLCCSGQPLSRAHTDGESVNLEGGGFGGGSCAIPTFWNRGSLHARRDFGNQHEWRVGFGTERKAGAPSHRSRRRRRLASELASQG